MKRYQVFVSSTYEDLKEERTEVLHALLELDCIPCGMEYFPATDDSQWEYIKSMIGMCDYYLLIMGGRYGSLDDGGISYTEKEYRYAVEKNIPVIAFYHNAPNSLPVNKTDDDPLKKKRLEAFRKLVQKKLCKPWETKEQLGAIASRSMIQLMKSHPRIGWIRADQITNEENLKELLSAKKKIEELQNQIDDVNKYNINLDNLASGEDKIDLTYHIWRGNMFGEGWNLVRDNNTFTWNEIFDSFAPKMNLEIATTSFNNLLNQYLNEVLEVKHRKDIEDLKSLVEKDRFSTVKLKFSQETLATIKIQFTVLGYIEESQVRREKQNVRVIKLTDLGHRELITRRAVRKSK
uniref:DUF4062 domain-containing protein n=1 Tax=uncultured Dysgonomonas sp. TaxID=206096 RepID=UPI00260A54CB|nr:DUF4062 domain-containing protein [uncultured Dysgonomonas sp.]